MFQEFQIEDFDTKVLLYHNRFIPRFLKLYNATLFKFYLYHIEAY